MLISDNQSVTGTQISMEAFFSVFLIIVIIWMYHCRKKKKKKNEKVKMRSKEFKQCKVFSLRPFMIQGQVNHGAMLAASHNRHEGGIIILPQTESSLL